MRPLARDQAYAYSKGWVLTYSHTATVRHSAFLTDKFVGRFFLNFSASRNSLHRTSMCVRVLTRGFFFHFRYNEKLVGGAVEFHS